MFRTPIVLPIYVIDTSVICHNIKSVLQSSLKFDSQEKMNVAAVYADLALMWTNALGFLPSEIRPKEAVVVWVSDSKPYWRSHFFPKYKHGRSTPPPFFYNLSAYAKSKYKALGFNQYEADDVAALIYKMWLSKRDEYAGLNFVTCDTDWMGFCSDGVTWFDTGGYMPRIRREPDVKDWILRKMSKGTKVQKAYEMPMPFKASHLWDYKIATGDVSDNLPAGCDRYLIDLLNPHPSYTLWQSKSAVIETARYLRSPQKLSDPLELHFRMSRMGFNTPITPIAPDQISNAA